MLIAFVLPYQEEKKRDSRLTGWPSNVLPELMSLVRDKVQHPGVARFFIGIASNGDQGVRNRWNEKYRKRGYSEMCIVYSTSSDDHRKQIEKALVTALWDMERLDNEIGGGGGPASQNNQYSVYLALKLYKPPRKVSSTASRSHALFVGLMQGPRGGLFGANSEGVLYRCSTAWDAVEVGARLGNYIWWGVIKPEEVAVGARLESVQKKYLEYSQPVSNGPR